MIQIKGKKNISACLCSALPGFLITAPPSVCAPNVIGTLACGFQTNKKILSFLF